MENKKSKLPIICVGIIIVLLIVILVLLVVLLNKDNKGQSTNTDNIQNNEQVNVLEQNSNNQVNTENIQNNEQLNVAKTDEEIIKEEVLEYLNKANDEAEEKFLDCRIDSVTIVTGKDKEDILNMDQGQYYKDSDILFEVSYSVKPQDTTNGSWLVGNATLTTDGWVNLHQVGNIRDGKIGSQGLGTGW